jgi:hypothetical protein
MIDNVRMLCRSYAISMAKCSSCTDTGGSPFSKQDPLDHRDISWYSPLFCRRKKQRRCRYKRNKERKYVGEGRGIKKYSEDSIRNARLGCQPAMFMLLVASFVNKFWLPLFRESWLGSLLVSSCLCVFTYNKWSIEVLWASVSLRLSLKHTVLCQRRRHNMYAYDKLTANMSVPRLTVSSLRLALFCGLQKIKNLYFIFAYYDAVKSFSKS